MIEIPGLVELARDGDVDAYGQVVRHLQNAAIGYAYSRLGDFHLAEDASQEAFLDAHVNLDQLRDPAAFPGWIRRILATRWARLRQPARSADRRPRVGAWRWPIRHRTQRNGHWRWSRQTGLPAPWIRCPANTVTWSRSYYGGMAQRDIAAFLDIPVHTVKNRLFAARKQLKEMIVMVKNDSEEQRHARGHRLAGRVIGDVWQRHALSTVVGTLHAALTTVTTPGRLGAWPVSWATPSR